jgi:hypothetical protein
MSTVYLKIKIMSLAAEARIIRAEQARHRNRGRGGPSDVWWGLHHHRTRDVRSEARSASLAYGFLRGRALARIEQRTHTQPNWKRVEDLIRKYGEGDLRERMQRFTEWKEVDRKALAKHI